MKFLNNILNWTKYFWVAFPKSPSVIMAWIRLSRGILPLLFGGAILVVISRTASSGAMLVGCAIVSQALLQIWPFLGLIGGRKSKNQIEMDAMNPGQRGVKILRGYFAIKGREDLRKIALDRELNFDIPNRDSRWAQELTISRVYFSLEWCIVFSAVVGTIVWAYGPPS